MSISEVELQKLVGGLPPALSQFRHKGQAGRIGIIGGCSEYTGAPYFAAITALKCGADLAYVFCTRDAAAPIKSYSPELIVLPYLDAEGSFNAIASKLRNMHSLVIGPGLGENAAVHAVVASVIGHLKEDEAIASRTSLVFDADGIGLLANNKNLLFGYPGRVYLTPNANEIKKLASAFLGSPDIDTEDETLLGQIATSISKNAALILKGRNDKIIVKDAVYLCSISGSLRRVGGQGDLLSGSLGLFSYWATLLNPKEQQQSVPVEVMAGYSACYITRLCSQFAFEAKGRSMITSDMIAQIEKAVEKCFTS